MGTVMKLLDLLLTSDTLGSVPSDPRSEFMTEVVSTTVLEQNIHRGTLFCRWLNVSVDHRQTDHLRVQGMVKRLG